MAQTTQTQSRMRSTMHDFEVLEKIGAGSFGVVFRARRHADGLVYVIKTVAIAELPRNEQISALTEVKVLSSSEHANVVAYYDSFVEDGVLHIVMEYCDKGDLQALLKRARAKGLSSLPEGRVWPMLVQMALGLHYLHSKRILHRDFKTGNVFLKSTSDNARTVLKIGDLGVAKLLGTRSFAETTVGTPYYLSPELVNDTPYNSSSDMWALGVVLYEMVTLRRPFEAQNQCALILKIVRGEFPPIPSENASSCLIDIINRLLTLDPTRRPSARKLLGHATVQRELFSLGLELPHNVEHSASGTRHAPRSSGPAIIVVDDTPNSGARHIASSRTENLAKPRTPATATATATAHPTAPSDHKGAKGSLLRGGRVRGGGTRKVSQRAQRSSPTQKQSLPSQHDTCVNPSLDPARDKERTRVSGGSGIGSSGGGGALQRPTVSDLLALAQSPRMDQGVVNGEIVGLSLECTCGNRFKGDSVFCRICGTRRPTGTCSLEEALAAKDDHPAAESPLAHRKTGVHDRTSDGADLCNEITEELHIEDHKHALDSSHQSFANATRTQNAADLKDTDHDEEKCEERCEENDAGSTGKAEDKTEGGTEHEFLYSSHKASSYVTITQNSFDYKDVDDYEAKEGVDDCSGPGGVEGTSGSDGKSERVRLQVLGWGTATSSSVQRSEDLDCLDDDARSTGARSDFRASVQDDSKRASAVGNAASTAAGGEHSSGESDDDSAGYSDDDWEDDAGEDEATAAARESNSLNSLAESARGLCLHALGGSGALSAIMDELGGNVADLSLQELIEKLLSHCDYDRLRAHTAAMALQRLLAAESGLKENHSR